MIRISRAPQTVFAAGLMLMLGSGCLAATKPAAEAAPAAGDAPAEASVATSKPEQAAGAKSGGNALQKCDNPVPAKDGLIDDFEDEDDQLADQDDRSGHWFIGKDDKGTTVEPSSVSGNLSDGGANGTKKALHVTGKTASGDGAWGVEVNADFAPGRPQYDASQYAGVSFFIKSGSTKTKTIRFKASDVNTNPTGGVCKACFNHFGKDIKLTPEWQEVTVSFAQMKQLAGWGDPFPAITPSKLYDIEFAVASGQQFDFWVDEIKFFKCGK
jgi:Carbohydrate binding domain (family 11)